MTSTHGGYGLCGERPAGRDLRVEESRYGAELAPCVQAIQEDRDPRAPLFQFKKRALVHFAADPDEVHMTTRLAKGDDAFSAVQSRQPSRRDSMRRGQPATSVRLPHRLLLGGGAAVRQLPRYPRPLHVHREDRGKGGRRQGRQKANHQGDDDLSALPSTRRSAKDGVGRAGTKGRATITSSSIPPAAARPIASPGFRIGWPACTTKTTEKIFDCVIVITDRRVLDQQLAGRDLPDRACPRRGEGHRRGLEATGGGVGRWNQDRHHDFAKVSLRVARAACMSPVRRLRKTPRKRKSNKPKSGKRPSPSEVCRDRGRGALQPDR